jgi:hypothetical protein
MRKLRILEHISLDGVIQVRSSGEDGDDPYGDRTAPYHSPAGRDAVLAAQGESFVYPVLLGKGKRFFAEGTPPRAFELASTKALSSGIVINAYKAAGPLKNQP